MMTNSVKLKIAVIKWKLLQSQQNFAYTKAAQMFWFVQNIKHLTSIDNFIGETIPGMCSTDHLKQSFL